MKSRTRLPVPFLVVLLLVLPAGMSAPGGENARYARSFDTGWRFRAGDLPGAEQLQFDDGAWRRLDVPHDWSIEGPFDQANKTGGAGAFLPSGVAWYRKHFAVPPVSGDSSAKESCRRLSGLAASR